MALEVSKAFGDLRAAIQRDEGDVMRSRGPFIKDVRTKGARGVSPKADIVREVAWILYYK